MASRKAKPPLRGFIKGKNPITQAPSDEPWGRAEILIESIKADNRTVYEAVMLLKESTTREISELRRDLSDRIDALRAAVGRNTDDIRDLQKKVDKLTEAVIQKTDQSDLERLEVRVAALERRVGG